MAAFSFPFERRIPIVGESLNGSTSLIKYALARAHAGYAAGTAISWMCQFTQLGAGENNIGYLYSDHNTALTTGLRVVWDNASSAITTFRNGSTAGASAINNPAILSTAGFLANDVWTYCFASRNAFSDATSIIIYMARNDGPLLDVTSNTALGSGDALGAADDIIIGNRASDNRTWQGDIFWQARWDGVYFTLAQAEQARRASGYLFRERQAFHYANGRDYSVNRWGPPDTRSNVTMGARSPFVTPIRVQRTFVSATASAEQQRQPVPHVTSFATHRASRY